MHKPGGEYVLKSATFFEKLGLKAEIEKKVIGARGAHNIDVWVTGKLLSFEVRWVIECKDWKSSVPKEKVLALQSIAMDVGSDRAFLLSESGFQAGAVRCAKFTNITLTSLKDLQEQTREQFAQDALWALYLQVSRVIDNLNDEPIRIYIAGPATGCIYFNPKIDENVMLMKRFARTLIDSFLGKFPVEYIDKSHMRLIFKNTEQLIEAAHFILADAENLLTKLRIEYPDGWYKRWDETQQMEKNKEIDENKIL